ncbi:DUF4232 domain-containing protein [Curtobacterium flaccumfaciens pv. flaccumfaciens]|uniref:DUF4232 domain-containing protein n=1 Tax=Curtobacterium flaccumfaciens TaxID=2035 RepID=UPI003AB8BF8D
MKHRHFQSRTGAWLILSLTVALTLAGCSGSHSSDPAAAEAAGSWSSTPAASSSSAATSDPAGASAPAEPASPPSAAGGGEDAGTRSGSGHTADSGTAHAGATPQPCTVHDVTGKVAEWNGAPAGSGAGAGHNRVAIVLTNHSSRTCTLQGWPGASYVGGGNGTQLGAPAKLDRSTPHPTVPLKPDASAQAPVDFLSTGSFPDGECKLVTADGLRVYPPGSQQSLFIPHVGDGKACSMPQHVQMTVGAFTSRP